MALKLKIPTLSDKAISILALGVAFFALVITAYEGYATRRHNRLSVKPFLFTSFDYDNEGSGWSLYNKGVGPALIKWCEVRVDGQPMHDWREAIEKLGAKINTEFEFSMPSWIYEANRTNRLLWLPRSSEESVVRANHNRLVIKLCFCSIYDECWIRETNSEPKPVGNCSAIEAVKLAPPTL
jgi:hypothetical protein